MKCLSSDQLAVTLATGLCLMVLSSHPAKVDALQSGLHMMSSISSPFPKTVRFYRDRDHHEQEHLIVSTPPNTPTSVSGAVAVEDADSVGGIHYEMFVQTAFRQFTALGVTTLLGLVGTGGHLTTLFPATTAAHTIPLLAIPVVGALAAVPLIYGTQLLHQSNIMAVEQTQLRTTDLCDRMFGRRHYNSTHLDDDATTTNTTTAATTSTITVLCLLAALTGLVTTAEELIFRVYAVGALQLHGLNEVAMPAASSILASATLFGLVHTNPEHRLTENGYVASQHFLCALWYSFLLGATGSVLVPAMAHWLYDWHTLAASWHSSNTQQDYVSEQHVDEDPVATLFYAFDAQHQGTLSHQDVQHAVAFLFLNDDPTQSVTPTHQQVEAELSRWGLEKNRDDRVSLAAFTRVIHALHQRQQSNTAHAN